MIRLSVLAMLFITAAPVFAQTKAATSSPAQTGTDIPSHCQPPTPDQDFTSREVMIPMRDGVKRTARSTRR